MRLGSQGNVCPVEVQFLKSHISLQFRGAYDRDLIPNGGKDCSGNINRLSLHSSRNQTGKTKLTDEAVSILGLSKLFVSAPKLLR